MIGRVLAGRYRIEAAIGEGGMSRVWRAQDMNTGKSVAVKVLRDEYQNDETFVRRFEREALAASRMTHPNIVNLLDVGVEEDGTRYLVIEYVSGKTLKQFIQESGALRPETAAQIIMRVLAAVQHAHQNGVIHRDIKPQNILIDKEGAVKVADFGIARVANSQTMNQDTETVMGSVYYFSPEQAKGAVVDEKSDIYSVGVVFYEMLTGSVPFTGDTPVAIAMKHLQEMPEPPSAKKPAVPAAIDYVVLHAMEKRSRGRYVSAADMLHDVRLALEHPDTILAAKENIERRQQEQVKELKRREHVETRVRWMRRLLVGAFATLLLLIIALAGYTITEQILKARRATIEIPSVMGKKEEDGVKVLEDLGLVVARRYDVYQLVPEDTIADQSIAPGTFVTAGETITIMVCQSRYELTMPNVIGIPLADAQSLLLSAGLPVSRIEREPSQADADIVILQSPAQGTPINRGVSVTLTISGGLVIMPRLVGMPVADAERTIIAYSLSIRNQINVIVDDPAQIGKVVGQVPAYYQEVMPRSTVEIEVGVASDELYSADITINLRNLPQGAAVSVVVDPAADEEDEQRYVFSYEEAPEQTETVVTVYSRTERAADYSVYFDDVLQYSNRVVFHR